MGMGRGAGRSALGFWPTLAFLLCSFPAAIKRTPGSFCAALEMGRLWNLMSWKERRVQKPLM
ncbi:RGMA isoform 5 [Pan troglodytes]|uniref:RGMA isoform 5 n=1 Tax=Pan troglodytes TaxID=9598 RepID=A0A2J8L6S9_PANTR|nr:RGMA isoform 5 [Pan troglodytes]